LRFPRALVYAKNHRGYTGFRGAGQKHDALVTSASPLAGLRVLELGSFIAGPSAGRILADLGADVLKVEPPEGDDLRAWSTPAPDGTSWWFKSHNRNKRLLCFDLHDENERAIVRRIALKCDVVLENFRPGRLAQWGLGAEELRRERPQLIYVSISGYGQAGPYAERAGFGNIAEAMGGLRHITGEADGPPMRMGISIGDELAGLYAAIGVLAALVARNRDGKGDRVDVSLIESCFSLLEGALPEYAALGTIRGRTGNRIAVTAPNSVYPTGDGKWFAIGANAPSVFRRFCALIGEPQLADDARFCDNRARTANIEELDGIVAGWTRRHDAAAISAMLAQAGVPAGPVYSIADICADEHFRARGAIAEIRDSDGNAVTTYGLIPRFAEHETQLRRAAGRLGEDTGAVLRELQIEPD
jgi:formyl-CoA transferase